MRQLRMQVTVFVALCCLFVLTSLVVRAVVNSPARFYSYGKKPSTAVIEVALLPGLTRDRITFTVYGDGKLAMVLSSGSEQRHIWGREVWLGELEVERLVEAAVNAGLVRFDPRDQAEGAKRSRSEPNSTDGSVVVFTITLDSYAEDSAPQENSVSNTFSLSDPAGLALKAPGVTEYSGISQIVGELSQIYRSELRKGRE